MNSRQTQRTLPGRGSVLLVSFPTLFKRSSSPPLITNPNLTNRFVHYGESPISKLVSQQNGRSPSKVLRESNLLQSTDNYHRGYTLTGNKKSLSAMDLRSVQRIPHDPGKQFWPKRGTGYAKFSSPGGIENLANAGQMRSRSTSTSNAGDKNTYAHGSILKKSAFENHPQSYEAGYINEGFLNSMKSKRKVLFKNKVSVFRFDSDGDSGRSSSECDKRASKNQTSQYRRFRTMTSSKGASNISKKSLPPPAPTSVSAFQRYLAIPQKSKPTIRNESVYLILGDESNENEILPTKNGNERSTGLLSTTSNIIDSRNNISPPQLQQQHQQHQQHHQQQQQQHQRQQHHNYESILYKTPSGNFIINDSLKEPDADSVSNSISSSKSSSKDSAGLLKSSKLLDAYNSPALIPSTDGKLPKKDSTFDYHVTKDSNKLVISVKLGLTLHPNDVLVKANKNGTKLRIVANPDSITTFKLNEQIMLPLQVNPYKLSAKIDQTGNLLIEAPISS